MAKTKRRTSDEIMSEYVQTCSRVGELEYRRRAQEAELEGSLPGSLKGLYRKLYDLNAEHAALVAATTPSTPSKEPTRG